MALNLPSNSEIAAIKSKYFSLTSASGWLVLGYKDANNIAVQGSGPGGIADAVKLLAEDQIQYILLRLEEKSKDVEDRKDGKVTTKDIFITWLGPNVRIIEKGKKQSHVGTVSKALSPFHAELTAINKNNITEPIVRDRAAPLSGSHVID